MMGTSMAARNVKQSWGTWYTGEGERADAWPLETRAPRAGVATRSREALSASSRLGLGGGGEGLSGFVGAGLEKGPALGGLL